jgi:hypothetical protein
MDSDIFSVLELSEGKDLRMCGWKGDANELEEATKSKLRRMILVDDEDLRWDVLERKMLDMESLPSDDDLI